MTTSGAHLQQVQVRGQWVRVSLRLGTGSGPPLLLCNGIGASLEVLQPFVDVLDPSMEVVSFDVPGVGGSPLPRLPYNLPLLARLVGHLLDDLGFDRFHVLGTSWGGALAQQLAFQFPRRCRRVVLTGTATGMLMIPARPDVLWKLATPRRHRDAAYAVDNAAALYGGQLRARPELAQQVLHAHSHPGSRRGYLLQLLAGLGWTSLPALPFLRQPVLLLAGRDDPIIPIANAHLMRWLLPRATLHVYDDGHLGLITSADELAPLVAEFLLCDRESA
jgi:poly(3-hydroxyalkanoate) depolymerase